MVMKKSKKTISIVVPCYNEEKMIPLFYDAIKEEEEKMDYVNFEYIFVNDGSKDNTLKELKKIAKKDKRVHYISFSRNFGKEAAMYAGLSYSKGDYVTIMDADLQDPPSLLPDMYE
jgi:glycosyltransferase involved in cell wall biosynthesis